MTEDLDLDLTRVLMRAAEQLPDDPGRWAGVQRIRRRRRLRRTASVAGAAVLVLAGGVAVVALRPAGSDRATVVPAAAGQVTGQGTVVATPGYPVRFCYPLTVGTDLAVNGTSPYQSCVGVEVIGVDLSTLTDRTVIKGVISGQATLQGRYTSGVLHVASQRPFTATRGPGPTDNDHPPCLAPAAGWYRNGHTDNPDVHPAQAYQAAHPTQIVDLAIARPTRSTSLILLLTEGDPAPVRAALASAYPPNQICVARSDYTNAQISAVKTDPDLNIKLNPPFQGTVTSTGLGLNRVDDQDVYEVGVIIETPAIAAAVARHPAGLVQIYAWLKPI